MAEFFLSRISVSCPPEMFENEIVIFIFGKYYGINSEILFLFDFRKTMTMSSSSRRGIADEEEQEDAERQEDNTARQQNGKRSHYDAN